MEDPAAALKKLARARTVRPFFSSTFNDFRDEREHLTKNVWPVFEQMCKEKGNMYVPIDLRWGITAEQSAEGQTIKICLSEVDKSRPFFITMLGERYGWCHGGTQEAGDEMLAKTFKLAEETWPWLADYEDRSVTELEILHAFLHNFETGKPVDTTHMRAYLRKPEDHHQRDDNPKAGGALARLKERLRQSPVQVLEYGDVTELGEYILSDLKAMLGTLCEIQRSAKGGSNDTELESHEFYSARISQFYVAGESYRQLFSEHFGYAACARKFKLGTPLLLSGQVGSGKSALSAHLASWATERLEALDTKKPICVIVHHVGCSVQSKSHLHFVRRVLNALKATFSIEKEVPSDGQQLVKCFGEWMEIAAERGHTLVILDGIDKLNNSTNAHDMSWLADTPRQEDKWAAKMAVVSNFQLVVTATTGSVQHNALLRRKWRRMELTAFDSNAKRELSTAYLKNRGRNLSSSQLERVVDAPQTAYPLFLRAVLEELVVFGQYEKLDARIDELLQSPDVVDVYTYKIDRMQANVDENYVKDILSFMWVSRAGLATDELVALIGVPKQTFDEIKEALGGFLIDRSGLLDFIDPMLREAVQKVFLSHKAFERDCRKRLARFLEERYEPDSERYVEAAWQYWNAKEDAKLLECITHPQAFALFRGQGHREDFMIYCRQAGQTKSGGAAPKAGAECNTVLDKLTERLGIDDAIVGTVDQGEHTLSEMSATTLAVADFAIEVARFPVGERLYNACLPIDEGLYGTDSAQVARDCLKLATLYVRFRVTPSDGEIGFVKGRALLDRASSILSGGAPEDSSEDQEAYNLYYSTLSGVYHLRGLLNMFERKLDDSMVDAEQALALRRKSGDMKNAADTLNLCGSISMQKGMKSGEYALLDAAEDYYKESLEIREGLLSRSDPDIGQVLTSMGAFYLAQGNLPEAEARYERARRVYVEGLGPKHVRGAYPLIGLAEVENKKPLAEKDFLMIITRMEQVVDMRSVLGPEAKDYKDAQAKLRTYKAEQLRLTNVVKNLQRHVRARTHWQGAGKAVLAAARLKKLASEKQAAQTADVAQAPQGAPGAPAAPAAAAPAAAKPTLGMPPQQFPPYPMQYPPQQYPPYYPPPPAPQPSAMSSQMEGQIMTFVGLMASRVEDLEARVDTSHSKMLELVETHHAEVLRLKAAENERLAGELERERGARDKLMDEMVQIVEENASLKAENGHLRASLHMSPAATPMHNGS